MLTRPLPRRALMAMGVMSILLGCQSAHRPSSDTKMQPTAKVAIHYLEIVTNDADKLTALYERMLNLSFGPPDPDLGQARVASREDGSLVGIRKPLAAHEHPIMRTYLAVEDIQEAVKKAAENGATVAYPPTRQGRQGTFAIVIQGDVENGLWQR